MGGVNRKRRRTSRRRSSAAAHGVQHRNDGRFASSSGQQLHEKVGRTQRRNYRLRACSNDLCRGNNNNHDDESQLISNEGEVVNGRSSFGVPRKSGIVIGHPWVRLLQISGKSEGGASSSTSSPQLRRPSSIVGWSCLFLPIMLGAWWYWTKRRAKKVATLLHHNSSTCPPVFPSCRGNPLLLEGVPVVAAAAAAAHEE